MEMQLCTSACLKNFLLNLWSAFFYFLIDVFVFLEVCKRHWEKSYFVTVVGLYQQVPLLSLSGLSSFSAGIARKFLGVGNREIEGVEIPGASLSHFSFACCGPDLVAAQALLALEPVPPCCRSESGHVPTHLRGMPRAPHVPPSGNLQWELLIPQQ